jgi:hypothetical protein
MYAGGLGWQVVDHNRGGLPKWFACKVHILFVLFALKLGFYFNKFAKFVIKKTGAF